MIKIRFTVIFSLYLLVAFSAFESSLNLQAATHVNSKLKVINVWSREVPEGTKTAAAYVEKIHNGGDEYDELISISSPVAARLLIHETVIQDGIARMRHVDRLKIPQGHSISFEPGGLHIMLINLEKRLLAGETFPITFNFQRAGKLNVIARVLKVRASTKNDIKNHKTKHRH